MIDERLQIERHCSSIGLLDGVDATRPTKRRRFARRLCGARIGIDLDRAINRMLSGWQLPLRGAEPVWQNRERTAMYQQVVARL